MKILLNIVHFKGDMTIFGGVSGVKMFFENIPVALRLDATWFDRFSVSRSTRESGAVWERGWIRVSLRIFEARSSRPYLFLWRVDSLILFENARLIHRTESLKQRIVSSEINPESQIMVHSCFATYGYGNPHHHHHHHHHISFFNALTMETFARRSNSVAMPRMDITWWVPVCLIVHFWLEVYLTRQWTIQHFPTFSK